MRNDTCASYLADMDVEDLEEERSPRIKYITDPKELRVLSHPLRGRLLAELYARGSGSVSLLAALVDEPINKVSFHLRQLAKYGFVEDAPELARDGRDRYWRVIHPDGVDIDPGLYELTSKVPRSAKPLSQFHGAFLTLSDYMRANLDDVRGFCHDWYLRMTPDELAEFDREYVELCMRWRDRTWERDAGSTHESSRRTYTIYSAAVPASDTDQRAENDERYYPR